MNKSVLVGEHPKTMSEAVLTRGVIDAITYEVNHPGVVCHLIKPSQ